MAITVKNMLFLTAQDQASRVYCICVAGRPVCQHAVLHPSACCVNTQAVLYAVLRATDGSNCYQTLQAQV